MPEFGTTSTGQVINLLVGTFALYALGRAIIRAWFDEKARYLREMLKKDK